MAKYKYNPRELQDLEERFLDSEDPYGIASDVPFYHPDQEADRGDAAPIDVVEVVRCKDCKHRGNDIYCPMCHCETYYDDDDGLDYTWFDNTVDNGFCNKGQREDE